MIVPARNRFAGIAFCAGLMLMGGFTGLVVHYDRELRGQIRQKMIDRDAAVLSPIAQQQVAAARSPSASDTLLTALRPDAGREGLLAMAVFDADGVTLERVPSNQPLIELPPADFARLQNGRPIARFYPDFSMRQLFPDAAAGPTMPVLEVLLALHASRIDPAPLGFVRYHLDGRALAAELAVLDRTLTQQTFVTLTLGLAMIALIVAAAFTVLHRAQRTILERTGRLVRANIELTLAAKVSALGQISSHLVHGLQGSVAGLRAVVDRHEQADPSADDWRDAANYTDRMQAIIQESVALLGDSAAQTVYELSGSDLAEIVRLRGTAAADKKAVALRIEGGFAETLDSHRGGVLCLIVSNLVENAIAASERGHEVIVRFSRSEETLAVAVCDDGPGIPPDLRERIFEPGYSTRPGGTGLGLAISQLLARQIDASLSLLSTGPNGTVFQLSLPIASRSRS